MTNTTNFSTVQPSLVRNIVPYIVGLFVSWLASKGLDLNPDAQFQISAILTVVIGSLYLSVVKIVEQYKPKVGLLIGGVKSPVVPAEVWSADVAALSAEIDSLKNQVAGFLEVEAAQVDAVKVSASEKRADARKAKAKAAAKVEVGD